MSLTSVFKFCRLEWLQISCIFSKKFRYILHTKHNIVALSRFWRHCGLILKKGKRGLEKRLDLVVENKHKSATGTTEDVGECALEEGTSALVLGDGGPAVHRALVHDVGLGPARLHHHATTHGVEGIRNDASDGGHSL
jgi:hypothetical protein